MNNNETANTANTVNDETAIQDTSGDRKFLLKATLFALAFCFLFFIASALLLLNAGDMFLDSVDGNCILWEVRGATDQFVRNNC